MRRSAFRVAYVLGLLVGAMLYSSSYAQQVVNAPLGALGRRYVEVSGGRADAGDDLFDHAIVGGLAVNMPVTRGVDVGLAGSFGRTEGSTVPGMLASSADVKSRRRALALIGTGYLRNQILSPFVRIAAGYEWTEVEHVYRAVGPAGTSLLANQKESEAVWGAGFGAE